MIINNSNFKLQEIPNFHPELEYYERISFWGAEKRKCIEGYWVSGKWMPGPLYYYTNFHHILFEDDSSVAQAVGLPWLRDIDWELFFYYEECRGFSGFELDTLFTCDRKYGPEKELAIKLKRITEAEANSKIYVPARDYLRKNHGTALGKPLYKNSSKHFMSMQSRGGGKSYATSGISSHNFLFDGATDYDVYLERKQKKEYIASDTIIGAIDTKYTEPLIKKIKASFEHLPGSYRISGDEYYPSPLLVSYTGSLAPNREYTSKTGSVLRHRTFKDNPLAANGTRPNFIALDEIGFMYNIKESWGAIEATQASKTKKNLVIWALGTGGLVSGQAALYAETIFRNPEDYNCLVFDDIYENRGKIGYFVPYTLTLNEFKSKPDYITDEVAAMMYIEHRRKEAKKSEDPSVYQTEIINGPIVPSEVFLVVEGSYFPILYLKSQLAELQGGKYKKYLESSFRGSLVFNEQNKVEFVSIQDARPIRNYPLNKVDPKSGCVEIWVKPQTNDDGVIPYGTFIAGMDVVDKARSTTNSLPSIFIMNRYTRQIVAEYTGRTDDPNEFYEICRKLLLYYNATGMYEKNLPGLYTYFERHKCTYLLADTPYQLRNADTYRSGTNTSKGIDASGKVNQTGRDFIKSWLLEKVSENSELRVLETIYSPALLQELIMWNIHGNFDRVSALGMLMWHDATMKVTTEKRYQEVKTFLDDPYFAKMGVLRKVAESRIVPTDFFNS
jgi:hypothetical protein